MVKEGCLDGDAGLAGGEVGGDDYFYEEDAAFEICHWPAEDGDAPGEGIAVCELHVEGCVAVRGELAEHGFEGILVEEGCGAFLAGHFFAFLDHCL